MEEKWLECHQHLLNGEYDGWWPRHEWIRTGSVDHKDKFVPTPDYGFPVWEGEMRPYTLLVNADFGMGDTIHFSRFLEEAKSRLYYLLLRCDEDFKTLFEGSFHRGIHYIGKDEPIPEGVVRIIHMMALPHVLGKRKEDISGQPYLMPNPDKPFDKYLTAAIKTSRSSKIGVCWQGNPFNPRDPLRTLPEAMRQRFTWNFDPAIYFYNLNRIPLHEERYINFNHHFNDWNQTAHFIDMMDLVITVDTAVAHLAGAIGKPVWLLLNNEDVDWRWGKDGSRTIWYDSMRIFRRTSTWTELIDRVAQSIISPTPDLEWGAKYS